MAPGRAARSGRCTGSTEGRARSRTAPLGAAPSDLSVLDGRPRAALPHEPPGQPDLGDRSWAAQGKAVLSRRGLRRSRQPRRADPRSGLRDGTRSPARSRSPGRPLARRRPRRLRAETQLHTGRAEARHRRGAVARRRRVGPGEQQRRGPFRRSRGHIWGLDLPADGSTLVTAATDGRAIVWDLAGDRRIDRHFTGEQRHLTSSPTSRGVAVSPDGRTLAVTHRNGMVELLATATLERRTKLPRHAGLRGQRGLQPGRPPACGRAKAGGSRCGIRAPGDSAVSSAGRGGLAGTGLLPGQQPARRRRVPVRTRNRPVCGSGMSASGARRTLHGQRPASSSRSALTESCLRPRRPKAGMGSGMRTAATWSSWPSSWIQPGDGDPARSVAFSEDGSLLVAGQYDGTVPSSSRTDVEARGPAIRAPTGDVHRPGVLAGRPHAGHGGGPMARSRSGTSRRASRSARRSSPIRTTHCGIEPGRLTVFSGLDRGARARPPRHVAGVLEAARMPRCRARAHTRRVGRGAPRAALPGGLLRRLSAPRLPAMTAP